MRPLNIPVVLGTTRQGRHSLNVARVMTAQLAARPGVETRLIDIAALPLPVGDAGEAIKDGPFSAAMRDADGLVLVVPEYNHSFPGLLKHVLDSCLSEYVHQAVGVVGVSAGPFGGTRVVQSLLPVLREIGLVTIFWDVNVGQVETLFDAQGALTDTALLRRSRRFFDELVWMSAVLRHGRAQVSVDAATAALMAPGVSPADAPPVPCDACGTPMTHHADKPLPADEPAMMALNTCPACGASKVTGSEPGVEPALRMEGASA
jgi:NAD(P)H-dependent FMN reductase